MLRFLVAGVAGAMAALAGCDWLAQRDLRPGESTREDVERKLGKPAMVWQEDDGRALLEYPRGPAGHQTWLVEIGPDGRYRGMRDLLTEENFARVRPGMSTDEVRRLLGRPTEQTRFELKQELVWSWRFMADQNRSTFFNVHFDAASGRVRSVSRTPDPERING